jgi:monoterpene epsilon-lactone hydrolase
MTSIQGHLIKLYMRYVRLTHPSAKEFNLVKERAEMEGMAKMFKPLAAWRCEPVNANGVPAEWITPQQVMNGRTILYLHGGYYLMGSIRTHHNLAGNIATAAQARALIIDYRLAPEHPFPAGLEDSVTAYQWLITQGINAAQIYLVGDSAGGGLVLSSLLALRGRGIAIPAGAVCLSPVTNVTMSDESWKSNGKKELVLSRYIAEKVPSLYLRDHDPRDPLASPIYGELSGLPPLLIQVGSDEVLLSHSTSLAERALHAGVDVRLEIWPGMFHVWQYTASMVPEARHAIEKIAEFIQTASEEKGI